MESEIAGLLNYETTNVDSQVYLEKLPKTTIQFSDVFGLDRFLLSDDKVLLINTPDSNLEAIRIYSILQQLENAPSAFGDSGKSLQRYMCARNQNFVNWPYLRRLLDKTDTKFANLLIIEVSSNTDDKHDKTYFKKMFECLSKNLLLKIVMIKSHKECIVCKNTYDILVKVKNVTGICFADLTKVSQRELLTHPLFLFQGKPTSLEEFLLIDDVDSPSMPTVTRLKQIINAATLKPIINGFSSLMEICGDYLSRSSFNVKPYIDRRFYNRIILQSKEIPSSHSDLLIFSNIKDTFEIVQSSRNIPVNEIDLIQQRTILLSGDSGTGKSTTLDHLTTYISSSWIIKIDIRKYKNIISQLPSMINKEIALDFLYQGCQNHFLTTALLTDVLYSNSTKPLYILFDYFEEIVDNTGDCKYPSFLRLLQFFHANTKAHIWITAETHNTLILENNLSVSSFRFEELNSIQVHEFLTEYWKNKLKLLIANFTQIEEQLLRDYAHKLIENNDELFGSKTTFLDVPHLLHLFAEAALPPLDYFTKSTKFEINHAKNIFEVLENSVQTKYSKYIKTKLSDTFDETNKVCITKCLNKTHGIMALKKRFPDYKKLHEVKQKNSTPNIREVGFISSVEQIFYFAHRTFEDYFIANIFATWLSNPTESSMEYLLISKILIEPDCKIIRLFLNYSIKKYPVTESFQAYFTKRLTKLWREDGTIFFNKNHEWALHILIKENLTHLATLFVNENFLEKALSLFVARDKTGRTALFLCAEHKAEILIKSILDHFNRLGKDHQRKLIWASLFEVPYNTDTYYTTFLLNKIKEYNWVPDISEEFNQKTALKNVFNSVHENNLDALKMILSQMNNIAREYILLTRDSSAGTILHLSASEGFIDVVHYLLDTQNMSVDVLDHAGATPCMYAAKNGKLEMIRLLKQYGSNIDICDKYFLTALSLSAKSGHLEVVQYLLDNKVNFKTCDYNGISSLQHAAKSGYLNIVNQLIKVGCDMDYRDNFGMSAIAWAVKEGHFEIVDYLIGQGADTNVIDKHGMNLVQIGVNANQLAIVKLLTICRVNVNESDYDGTTALQRAVESKKWDMAEYLTLEGAKVDVVDRNNFSPIYYTVKSNQWALALLMVEQGAKLTGLLPNEKQKILENVIFQEGVSNNCTVSVYSKFYKVIRLGNVELLKMLIDEELQKELHSVSEAEQLTQKTFFIESFLSEPYEELLLKNVKLSPKIKYFVEEQLVQLRSFTSYYFIEDPNSNETMKKRIKMICKQIRILKQVYSGKQPLDVDQTFIVYGRFISENIEILKRWQSREEKKAIPWEQMQFCLVMFMKLFLKPEKGDFNFSIILDQQRIIKHLVNFSKILNIYLNIYDRQPESIKTKKEIDENLRKIRESIDEDFQIIKDIYSLNKISYYIDLALSAKKGNEESAYVVMRCLQVIGESFKNTTDSPNLSEDVKQYLYYSAPKNVEHILTCLRNFLSKWHTIKQKNNIENQLKKNMEYFETVQEDLKKIQLEVISVLFKKIGESVQLFLNKIKNSNEIPNIIKYVHLDAFGNFNIENYKINDQKTVGSLLLQASHLVKDQTNDEKILLTEILNKIDETDVSKNQKTYFYDVLLLKYELCFKTSTELLLSLSKNILNQNKTQHRKSMYNVQSEILNYLIGLVNRASEEVSRKLLKIIGRINLLLKFRDSVTRIEEMKKILDNNYINLSKNIIKEYFKNIDNHLTSHEDKNKFKQEMLEKENLHFVKNECIREKRNILGVNFTYLGDLFNKYQIKEANKKCYKTFIYHKESRNEEGLNTCIKLLEESDCFGKLLKKLNKDNFYETLQSFCAGLKNKAINKAVNKVIEEDRNEVKAIFLEKVHILKKFLINDAETIKGDKMLQSAIEILSLDVLDYMLNHSMLPDTRTPVHTSTRVLIGRSLRNYLAHGNLLTDILPFDPLNAIIATIKSIPTKHEKTQLLTLNKVTVESGNLNFNKLKHMLGILKSQNKLFDSIKNGKLKIGYEIEARDISNKAIFDYVLISDSVDIYKQFSLKRCYPLYECFTRAVQYGAIKIMKYIIGDWSIPTSKEKVYCIKKIGVEAFLTATLNGYKNIIKELLTCGINVNASVQYHQNHMTAICLAIVSGHKDIVEILFNHGAKVDETYFIKCEVLHSTIVAQKSYIALNFFNNSADDICLITDIFYLLYITVALNWIDITKILLNLVEINNVANILHIPAYLGNKDVMLMFMDHLSKMNVNCINKSNVLQVASMNGHANVVSELLKDGSEINVEEQRVALNIAVACGHMNVVDCLLTNNKDLNLEQTDGVKNVLHIAAKYGQNKVVKKLLESINVNSFQQDQMTALHIAVLEGYNDITITLLQKGADVNITDRFGNSALKYAGIIGDKNIIKTILDHVNDVKAVNEVLHQVCYYDHHHIIDCLLASDGNINAPSKLLQMTPLHYGAQAGHKETVLKLLKYKADITAIDKNGNSALYLATIYGHNEVVIALLQKNARFNDYDLFPLHVSSQKGYRDVVDTLLKYGIKIDSLNENQATALHVAASTGHQDVVLCLLEHGATIYAADLEVSIRFGHGNVVRSLLDHGANPHSQELRLGYTALCMATCLGFNDIVLILIKYGANVNAVFKPTSSNKVIGITALHIAASKGFNDIVKSLLRHGALINYQNEGEFTALHCAAYAGHKDVTISLLSLDNPKADVNCVNKYEETALHRAALNGYADIVKILINSGALVNIINKNKYSALHMAVTGGHLEVVDCLLNKGANINEVTDEQSTSLHIASGKGFLDIVNLLLEFRANVNAFNIKGKTPLHYAALHGHTRIVEILLKADAAINIVDENHYSPLYEAVAGGHFGVVKCLLEEGADVNAVTLSKISIIDCAVMLGHMDIITSLLNKCADVNVVNEYGSTPLHTAVFIGNKDIIKNLVKNGAYVNAVDKHGLTPLHVAITLSNKEITSLSNRNRNMNLVYKDEKARYDVINILITFGANINITDKNQRSPLYEAVVGGYVDIVKLLLDNGAEVNRVTRKQSTPLHEASARGYENIVKCLLSFGANVNTANQMGHTALHNAAALGHINAVKVLLDSKADISIIDNDHQSALHMAVIGGHVKVVKCLLDKNADVDAKTKKHFTCIHLASLKGFTEIVKCLLDAKANVTTVNEKGRTALHYAAALGYIETVNILIKSDECINITDENHWSALHMAVANGNVEVVKSLLNTGADINAITNKKSTSLHLASEKGFIGIVKVLLDVNVNVNSVDETGQTALHYAAENGHIDVVNILLHFKADIKITDNDHLSALDRAVSGNHVEIVKCLREEGLRRKHSDAIVETESNAPQV